MAGRLAGRVQADVDELTARLAEGQASPGSGSRSLFNGIWEARTKSGARVAYRYVKNRLEILAKFDKRDQVRALNLLRKLYGG